MISIAKLKRPYNHFIFIIGISLLVRWHLYIETGPKWSLDCLVLSLFGYPYSWKDGLYIEVGPGFLLLHSTNVYRCIVYRSRNKSPDFDTFLSVGDMKISLLHIHLLT